MREKMDRCLSGAPCWTDLRAFLNSAHQNTPLYLLWFLVVVMICWNYARFSPKPQLVTCVFCKDSPKSWKHPTCALISEKMWSPTTPQPIHIRKALFLEIPKRYNIPLPTKQHCSAIQPSPECMCNLCNLLCNGTDPGVYGNRQFSQKYGLLPPPNPYIFEKPFSRAFRKGTTYPPPSGHHIPRNQPTLAKPPLVPQLPPPPPRKQTYTCVFGYACMRVYTGVGLATAGRVGVTRTPRKDVPGGDSGPTVERGR